MKSSIIYRPVHEVTATIITPPNKTTYNSGELFDPTGMVVKGKDIKGVEYTIDTFENIIMPPTPLVPTNTEQHMYVLIGSTPIEIIQPITVTNIPGTIYTASAVAYSGCNDMFNSITAAPTLGPAGTSVQFNALCKDGYRFVGWYDRLNNLVSTNSNYTHILAYTITLYARAETI